MSLTKIALPTLDGVADGMLNPMSIEALGFSPDGRNLLVRVSFLDSSYPNTLRSAVWEYNISTATYGSPLNNTIKTANPLLSSPDVTAAVYSNWQGQSQILALMQDAADQSSFAGGAQNHLVLIRNGTVVNSNLLTSIAGAQANQLITALNVTEDGRYAVIETEASNLTPDMSDTNEVSDIYLLDLLANNIRRVSLAGGAEVPDAATLGDVLIDSQGALNISFSSIGHFTTTPDTNGAPDVFLWKATGANTTLANNPTITLLSKTGNSAVSGELPLLTQAGTFFQSNSGLLAANDTNESTDTFFVSAADGSVSLISPGGVVLATGAGVGAASSGGRYVTLLSASPEISGDTGVNQLVVVDRSNGTYQVVSQVSGNLADDAALSPVMSANGQFVVFSSQAVNLQGGIPSPDISMQLYLASLGNAADNTSPSGSVTISGTATQGQTLTAANTLADADGMGNISYQWQDSIDGMVWSYISNAVGGYCDISGNEIGKQIRVEASYIDGHGTMEHVFSTHTNTVQMQTFTGTFGNDVLSGNDFDNILNGKSGADTMAGLNGNDIYYVDNVNDLVIENSNEGTDTVHSSITYILNSNIENLILDGSDHINGMGNDFGNVITGNSGNNVLYGDIGADTLIGDTGNDIYVVDNVGDTVMESSTFPTEIDTMLASISCILSANTENLTITGFSDLNGTGNDGANSITGNAGNNIIDGSIGNDILYGGIGNDSFNFSAALNEISNVDTIMDFMRGDHIGLSHSVFSALIDSVKTGDFLASSTSSATSATGTSHLLYNSSTGSLYYDADGAGGANAVHFAVVNQYGQLNSHPILTAADFLIK